MAATTPDWWMKWVARNLLTSPKAERAVNYWLVIAGNCLKPNGNALEKYRAGHEAYILTLVAMSLAFAVRMY